MDNVDIATDLVLERMERHTPARPPAEPVIAAECGDCGDEIPPARRKAMANWGVVRCIECQQVHDRKGGVQ